VTGSWRAHLLCLTVLAAQVGLWTMGHRSTARLRAEATSLPVDKRISALQILLERGEPDPGLYGPELAEELLADPDPRVRELAFTTAVTKSTGTGAQLRDLNELRDRGPVDAAFWRAFVIMRRKIGVVVGGSSGRLKRDELAWWLDALEDRAAPPEEILEYIREHP
jgi:hypothetical protein